MPSTAGLKQTSQMIAIGFSNTESGANTFTQSQVDLNLSPLDREVFVVLSVNVDVSTPSSTDDTDTFMAASLTSTTQTAVQNLSNNNCFAAAGKVTRAAGATEWGVSYQTALETPPANLPYIAIIATNDFFCQVIGNGNAAAGSVTGKVYGYRARASADIFAALVQSEVLSA